MMDTELNRRERDILASLPPVIDPPRELQERVIGELRRAGLLAPRRTRMLLSVAAALVLGFLGGLFMDRFPAAPEGREFILLVHDSAAMAARDEPQRIREYSQWARGLGGRLVDGEKLTDDVSTIGSSGPASNVGGFFRIRARDRAEADAIARSCPHVRYGGRIEVREIQRL